MTGSLVAAWDALERSRWEHARRDFEAALAVAETAEALEGLGAAAWWLEDVPLVLASRERDRGAGIEPDARAEAIAGADELSRLEQEAAQELQDPGRWGVTFTLFQTWGTSSG